MASENSALISRLNDLYSLCRAGEQGYDTVAGNVKNRGLKVLLRSFARERSQFANELRDEVRRLGGQTRERRAIRGIVHRGRIDIRAAMTIGAHQVEQLVLREALQGENVVTRAYEKFLDSEVDGTTRDLVKNQHEAIRAARQEIQLLTGQSGRMLVVRLFDSERDAREAVTALTGADYTEENIETIEVDESARVYSAGSRSSNEAAISGAVGGALWGTIIGAAAGLGAPVLSAMGMMVMENIFIAWLIITLGGTLFGSLFGIALGLLISKGVSEEDVYLYDDSVRYGKILLRLMTTPEKSAEAGRIMHQINCAARARGGREQGPLVEESELVADNVN